jgi:hypothetical protein
MRNDGSELAAVRRVLGKLTQKGNSERYEGFGGRWREIQSAWEQSHSGQLKTKSGTRKSDGADLVSDHRGDFLRRHEWIQDGDMCWDPQTF